MPKLTSGFSTAAETDIRTGSGTNQVEYNLNAPVSIDGGSGFNKLVILGTEFADHIVVTAQAIYGVGLSVTYQNIQVLEIDALEGDDTIDVLSTAPGVETRVIGGLGNDTLNVGGDVVGDVFSKDIEGTSGTVNHQVTSADPNYNGLTANGVDLSVARPGQGQVIISESGGFSAVYEGGCFTVTPVGCVPSLDSYTVVLAAAPTSNVYVTVSAANSPQEEQNGVPMGDTFLVATTAGSPGSFTRTITVNGVVTTVPDRQVVLVFTPGNWNVAQTVFMFAVDDSRVEGTRTVTVSQSVISADPSFDGAIVRNVEVTIYDNDAPGVLVTPLDPTTLHPDNATTVLEGTSSATPPATEVVDLYSIQLTSAPAAGMTVTVQITPSSSRVCLSSTDSRFSASNAFTDPTLCPLGGTTYFVTFTSANWFTPVNITVHARNDFAAEDPTTVGLVQTIAASTTDPTYLAARPGGTSQEILERIYATVIDDETPGVFVNQSDGTTVVTECGNAACTIPGPGDSYTLRLTSKPTDSVQVAIITDGQTDATIGGSVSLAAVGGLRPTQLFAGNITISGNTITLASGSDLGSFVSAGFVVGMRIGISGTGTSDDVATGFYVSAVTAGVLTLTAAPPSAGTFNTVSIASLTEQGTYTGITAGGHTISYNFAAGTLTRDDGTSWLDSGFVEGQLIKIGGDPTIYKINSFSSANGGNLNVLQLTSTAKPVSGSVASTATVVQWAAVVTFTTSNWYQPVTVPLVADVNFQLAPGRQNLKVFAKQQHILSGIAGPLSVEGGTTSANRSLHAAVLLPGEGNGPLFAVAAQPPEWQQIDTLNIYDDGSKQDQTGQLTSTALTGLNMGGDAGGILDFSYLLPVGTTTFPFGEPGTYPDGISYGTVTLDSHGKFVTDGNKSTIEVLNILLGQGNDTLNIVSTMVPGPDHNPDGTPNRAAAHGGVTTVHGGGDALLQLTGTFDAANPTASTGQLVRRDGLSWAGAGFAVGQQVTLSGGLTGTFTIAGFANSAYGPGSALLLNAALGATGLAIAATVSVSDSLQVTAAFDLSANKVVRRDGLPWQSLGFTYGQQVSIVGIPGTWTITGFDNSIYGDGTALLLSGVGVDARHEPLDDGRRLQPLSGGRHVQRHREHRHLHVRHLWLTRRIGPGRRPAGRDHRRHGHPDDHLDRRQHPHAERRCDDSRHRCRRSGLARPDRWRHDHRHGRRQHHGRRRPGLEHVHAGLHHVHTVATRHLRRHLAGRRLVRRKPGADHPAQLRAEAAAARQRTDDHGRPDDGHGRHDHEVRHRLVDHGRLRRRAGADHRRDSAAAGRHRREPDCGNRDDRPRRRRLVACSRLRRRSADSDRRCERRDADRRHREHADAWLAHGRLRGPRQRDDAREPPDRRGRGRHGAVGHEDDAHAHLPDLELHAACEARARRLTRSRLRTASVTARRSSSLPSPIRSSTRVTT